VGRRLIVAVLGTQGLHLIFEARTAASRTGSAGMMRVIVNVRMDSPTSTTAIKINRRTI
jgi:hypothetical protein